MIQLTVHKKIPNLLGLDLSDLTDLVTRNSESAYRGKQIYEWVYRHKINDLSQMTNLPSDFREKLSSQVTITHPRLLTSSISADGSQKGLVEFSDGARVEAVVIPEGDRKTLCLSTQVGCAVGCVFCATAKIGFKRNLTAGEIIGQFFVMQAALNTPITNIVMMGMGEPLLNRKALFAALRLFTDPDGINFSTKKITVSTAGWLPGIQAMTNEDIKVKLAISLNGTTETQRQQLMPLASKYSIKDILKSAGEYARKTGTKVSLNYLLLKGVNDYEEDAQRLVQYAQKLRAKVNLMEYNEIFTDDNSEKVYQSLRERAVRFMGILSGARITVTLRSSRGGDINAACGQLAAKYQGSDANKSFNGGLKSS